MTERKRKYGVGSVYKTSSGEWRGKVYIKDPVSGKSKSKTFYGKNETEIRRKIRDYQNDPLNHSGEFVAQADAARYFRRWADIYKKPNLKPLTYDRLDSVLRLYIEPAFEGMQLKSITNEDCSSLINDLKNKKKLSYSTVKKVYDALHGCFQYAVKKRDLYLDPMVLVNMPSKALFDRKKDEETIRHLTEEEETVFLAELDRQTASTNEYVYRYRDLFILDLNTGLRSCEIVALDWTDIDLKNKKLSVCKNAVMVSGRSEDGSRSGKMTQVIQNTSKTSKSTRDVPLNTKALAALKRLKKQAGDSKCVFPTKSGKRLVVSSLSKQYNNIAKKCGLDDTSMHSLRHTFATRLFERGADVKDVSMLLGHASVSITYNTYIHVIESRKKDVVDLLD